MVRNLYRWAIAAVMIVALIALVSRSGNGGEVEVQTADVTTGPIARRVLVSGTFEPERLVEVGSQVSGTIASIAVDFNSRVAAGDVLARIDPAAVRSRLAEAEAGVAKARAERARLQEVLEDAKRKLEAAEQLSGDQQLARAELDLARTTMLQSEADVRGADAGIAAAQAVLRAARVNLDRTIIRSPIDGVVIGRHVDVGQTIAATVNAPVLFTIGDLRQMRLLAEVPESEVGGVQRGSEVRFEIESLGAHAFRGTVAEVRLAPQGGQVATSSIGSGATPAAATTGSSSAAPAAASGVTQPASPATSSQGSAATVNAARPAPTTTATSGAAVSYVAVIDVDTANQAVPPGGTAVVTLAGSERRQAVRVSNNALAFAPSAEVLAAVEQEPPVLDRSQPDPAGASPTIKGFVWKFHNNRFVPIAVETGIADETWTEVLAGDIRPGDRLVTAAAVKR